MRYTVDGTSIAKRVRRYVFRSMGLTGTYAGYQTQPGSSPGGAINDDMAISVNLGDGKFVGTESFQIVEPRNNSIVFFNAAVMHEIMPVVVPSKQFRDSRFTVNGWVERT